MLKESYAIRSLLIALDSTGLYECDHAIIKVNDIILNYRVPFHSYFSTKHKDTGITISFSDSVDYLNDKCERVMHVGGAVETGGLLRQTNIVIPRVEDIQHPTKHEKDLVAKFVNKTMNHISNRVKKFRAALKEKAKKDQVFNDLTKQTANNLETGLSVCRSIGIGAKVLSSNAYGENMSFIFGVDDENGNEIRLSVNVDKNLNITRMDTYSNKYQLFFAM